MFYARVWMFYFSDALPNRAIATAEEREEKVGSKSFNIPIIIRKKHFYRTWRWLPSRWEQARLLCADHAALWVIDARHSKHCFWQKKHFVKTISFKVRSGGGGGRPRNSLRPVGAAKSGKRSGGLEIPRIWKRGNGIQKRRNFDGVQCGIRIHLDPK